MEWISGIKRDDNSELCVEVQDLQGARSKKYLKNVVGDLHQTGDIKNSMTVNLNDAKPASAKQYVADLGLQHLDASCQTAYQFDTGTSQFIIPSQLMILSLMGTTSGFRTALFKPWGLESFMIAFHDGEHLIYKLNPVRPTKGDGLTLGKCESHLRWLTSFQSARMAWSTVYRSALEGRFDMRLPAAKLTMAVYCRQVDNQFLVTKALLSTLETLEEPHAFMKGCIKEMSITDGRMAKMRNKSKLKKVEADHRVKHSIPRLRLTDTQWNCIEPLL